MATAAAAPSAAKAAPVKLTGVLVALVILGIVMFASPPGARLWIAAVVVVAALLIKGGDTANIINQLRVKIYGG